MTVLLCQYYYTYCIDILIVKSDALLDYGDIIGRAVPRSYSDSILILTV